MREPENIRAVAELGVDWIGLIFWPQSPRYVKMIPSGAGIIPDNADGSLKAGSTADRHWPRRVGVFVDATAQDIITHVVNYGLDIVQLHGHETPTLIRNLRRTLTGDVKMMKAISVTTADNMARWRDYADCADYLLFDTKTPAVGGSGQHFDWSILQDYDGHLPFLLSGGIGPDDALRLREAFATGSGTGCALHPRCIGIDLNSRFESAPGLKDVTLLKAFLENIGINNQETQRQ